MRTFEQAKAIAVSHLSNAGFTDFNPQIIDSSIQEFEEGWVFYYQSAKFLQSHNIADSLVGNIPLFVPRIENIPQFVALHRPLVESMAAYSACGNPNADLLPCVTLIGWRKGAVAIQAIQAIRQHSALGLGAAKHAIEECLDSRKIEVQTADVATAESLVKALYETGFDAEVKYGG